MAIKGLTTPVIGDYIYNGHNVTYVNGFIFAHAIEYGLEIETSEDNPLHGDDRIIEHDYGVFSAGTLTLNTSDLSEEDSERLLSVKKVQREIGGTMIPILVYDDDAKPTPKGFGIIEVHQINDKDKYRAVVLTKVTPRFPAEAATTRGESIEWQTKEVELGVERSDEDTEEYRHPWKYEAWFDTYTEALNFLKEVLNAIESLDVTSKEGGETGKTVVTIKDQAQGATYKYSTKGPTPSYHQNLTSWEDLIPGEEITVDNGTKLYVAQVDENKKAVAAGSVTVIAKGE